MIADEQLRLAIVSTPRSGNCWLRHMLSKVFELREIIVHLPSEIPWENLPPRAIVQLHWLPDDEFRGALQRHGFKVVVLARHPLDVLISALAFSQHDNSTLRWLAGAGGDERCIAGAEPLSESFLAYAKGSRAKALLGVSAAWWNHPLAVPVRYEDLMLAPGEELARLAQRLGAAPRKPPAEVAAQSKPEDMRQQNVHMLFHVWRAQGSLWRQFLPAAAARQIAAPHEEVFQTLGYACDPDEALSDESARQAWQLHDAAAVKRHLHGVKSTLIGVQSRQNQDAHAHRQQFEHLQQRSHQLEEQLQQLRQKSAELEQLQECVETLLSAHSQFDGLGPWSLGAARSLQRVAHAFPRVTAAAKSVVLWSRRNRSEHA